MKFTVWVCVKCGRQVDPDLNWGCEHALAGGDIKEVEVEPVESTMPRPQQ